MLTDVIPQITYMQRLDIRSICRRPDDFDVFTFDGRSLRVDKITGENELVGQSLPRIIVSASH